MNPSTKATMHNLPIHPTRIHPLTGVPLQAIGFRPDGSPLWPIMGGAEGDPPADDPWKKTFGDKTPEQVKADLDAASAWTATFKDKTPEKVAEDLGHSSKWEARAKADRKVLESLATQLGIKPEDLPDQGKAKEGTDVTSAVTEKLTGLESLATRQARELAMFRATSGPVTVKVKEGDVEKDKDVIVNTAALTDSLSFRTALEALDPNAADFNAQVAATVQQAVQTDTARFANPVQPAPQTSFRPDLRPIGQQGNPSEGKQGSVASGREAYRAMNPKRDANAS
jgi:hypothetical protein